MKERVAHCDFIGEFEEGFGFRVSNSSSNQILAQRLSKLLETNKPFRMYVLDIEEL